VVELVRGANNEQKDRTMITKEDMAKDLTHKSAGNGYAVVEFLPDDYCYVVTVTKDGIGEQVLKAWVKLMEPTRVVEYETTKRREHPKSVNHADSSAIQGGERVVRVVIVWKMLH
jgi:hypothetical protein